MLEKLEHAAVSLQTSAVLASHAMCTQREQPSLAMTLKDAQVPEPGVVSMVGRCFPVWQALRALLWAWGSGRQYPNTHIVYTTNKTTLKYTQRGDSSQTPSTAAQLVEDMGC